MIGYVMLGTNDYPRALDFYDKVLAPIGGKRAMDFGNSTAYANGQGGMLAVTPALRQIAGHSWQWHDDRAADALEGKGPRGL